MTHRHPITTGRLVLVAGLLALGAACGGSSEPTTTTPAPAKVDKTQRAAPERAPIIRAGPKNLGNLSREVPATVEGVREALHERWGVRAAGEGATEGAVVEVLFDGKVAFEVFPDASGEKIGRAWAKSTQVVFPFDTRVGQRIGSHKNWDRITCEVGEGVLEGHAFCYAFEGGHLGFLLDLPENGELPGKELMADAKIVGLIWTPPEPGDEEKAAAEGEGEAG